MDARRLEEFRRKLREGRSVRVVDGRVVLAEEAEQQKPEGRARGPSPVPPPTGVSVKPHEWGAAAQPLRATDAGVERALKEQAVLVREYPGFVMDVEDDGTVYTHGWIGPNESLGNRYHVLVVVPPGYGLGVMPKPYVLEPKLRDGAPHQFSDGSLCLDHSGAFTARSTLVTLLAWVAVWLVLYEGWAETGVAW